MFISASSIDNANQFNLRSIKLEWIPLYCYIHKKLQNIQERIQMDLWGLKKFITETKMIRIIYAELLVSQVFGESIENRR